MTKAKKTMLALFGGIASVACIACAPRVSKPRGPPVPISETVNQFAGYHEGWSPSDNTNPDSYLLLPGDSWYGYLDYKSWSVYRKQRANIDEQIAGCQDLPQSCSPRFRAWVNLIAAVNQIQDPLLKIAVVNGWVNTVVKYDNDGPRSSEHDGQIFQSPQDTLSKGTGVCIDYATLKYETLRRAGFRDTDMRLVEMRRYLVDGHAVLLVNINNENWILSNYQVVLPRPASYEDFEAREAGFTMNSVMITPEFEIQNYGFLPKVTFDDNGSRAYFPDTSAPEPFPFVRSPLAEAAFTRPTEPAMARLTDAVINQAYTVSANGPQLPAVRSAQVAKAGGPT
jgi:predicted transglutaminase-like cysteine proteinase